MATKIAQELKELSDVDLFERIGTTRQELFNLRFQHVTGQLENSARLVAVRRDVARLMTELREREIAAADALVADEERA
jgi:large subunit ribosomal protein L29